MYISESYRKDFSSIDTEKFTASIKVLKTIVKLYRTYKPVGFFGIIALILAIISAAFFIPIFLTFTHTGLVPNLPTLVVCGFTMLAAIQSFFAGLTLQTIAQKNKQDFEMNLQRVSKEKRIMLDEN